MKRGLQIALGVLSLIPLAFGALGLLYGVGRFLPFDEAAAGLDSQYRFLSAVYLGLAVLIWRIIPSVEKHGWIISTLVAAIFVGGLARVYSAYLYDSAPIELIAAAALELGSPLLILWQRAVARQPRGRFA
ncbi:MAG: DUF4345 domain-containing protein [Parvularculaceae bacterium]|nr:DUF4345 domain-containing protein [Parvularculaceae bacterium]